MAVEDSAAAVVDEVENSTKDHRPTSFPSDTLTLPAKMISF